MVAPFQINLLHKTTVPFNTIFLLEFHRGGGSLCIAVTVKLEKYADREQAILRAHAVAVKMSIVSVYL